MSEALIMPKILIDENAELKSIIKELISAIEQSSFCSDCQDEFGTFVCSECPWAQARDRGKEWMEESTADGE